LQGIGHQRRRYQRLWGVELVEIYHFWILQYLKIGEENTFKLSVEGWERDLTIRRPFFFFFQFGFIGWEGFGQVGR